MKSSVVLFVLVVIGPSLAQISNNAGAEAFDPDSEAPVSVQLDEYMTALSDAGRFTGSVLVAENGTVLLSKGYGMANYEFDVPNSPDTVFPIGSCTKQFTAAAIMKLQEQGLLNVSDPITQYIPNASPWNDIRIYNLLNHTSGIPCEGGYSAIDPTDIPLKELVRRFVDLPLTFKPGENYTYSNNGYITLSYIIEAASGQSFDEYLRDNLFLPLGMNSTGQDNAADVFKNRAPGYTTFDDKRVHYEHQNIHNSYGAGSLHSTTEDLYRWEQALYTPGKILSQASLDAMTNNDYGIVKAKYLNRTLIFHSGRNFGYTALTGYYPDSKTSIIFLSNYDRTPLGPLPRNLSAIVFGEKYTLPKKIERRAAPVDPEIYDEYIGTYEPVWEKTWTFNVFEDGNRLYYTSAVPHETVELFPEGNDTFFVSSESPDSFIFTRDENSRVNGFCMYTQEGVYDMAMKT